MILSDDLKQAIELTASECDCSYVDRIAAIEERLGPLLEAGSDLATTYADGIDILIDNYRAALQRAKEPR